MNYKKKNIQYVNIDEMIEKLEWCKKFRKVVLGPRRGLECHKYSTANIEVEITRIKLTFRLCNKTVTYISRLDGSTDIQQIDGVSAFSTMQKYYKIPDLSKDSRFGFKKLDNGKIQWIIEPMKQLIYFNEKLNNNRYNDCYGYDLNSSFSYAMMQSIPDTSQEPRFYDTVKENEIGFNHDGDVVESGSRANIIFPLMDSPFKRFITIWYSRKSNAKTPEEKAKAKAMLNYCIGYMQRKNPFIRNVIVWRSNQNVLKLMDENTLYCNTDSIVSKVKRQEIESNLGTNIGQWKIEHHGSFAYRGFTYQWDFAIPTYKGIPKEWFNNFKIANGRPWDLLVDKPPTSALNNYYFDEEKIEIVKKEIKHEI